MKCIRCQKDCKFKERSDGRCPHCNGRFAFEPRKGDPLTDGAFQGAIDAVSAQGQIRWGVEHLYYEVCRRKLRGRISTAKLIVLLLVVGVFVMPGLASVLASLGRILAPGKGPWPIAVAVLGWAGFVGLVLFLRRRKTVPLSDEQFNQLYAKWIAAHGAPAGVIVRQPPPLSKRPLESDVADYSFDRAVLCDRARTVDLLLANNFHFENNCAVLAVDGYPKGVFNTVRSMLKNNARLEIYALHDATEKGCHLASNLASDPEWFLGHGTVVDVGLRPAHARPFQGLYRQRPRRAKVTPSGGLTEEEARWLSRYELELAAIRPEQVLKRLYRAISKKIEADKSSGDLGDGGDSGTSGDSGSGSSVDQESFSSDASDSDGGADGFG